VESELTFVSGNVFLLRVMCA